jgi:polar amino acid transport system substrate-binding protein
MTPVRRAITSLALAFAAFGAAQATSAAVIRLASLEWPPHAGAQLEGEGTSIERVRQALAHEGLRLEVEFRPWTRAVAEAGRGDNGIVGFLPEYASDASRAGWWLSSPIGESPLGFVERRDRPVNWRQLEDLAGFRIGVVRGYINESHFDALAAKGVLTTEAAADDLTNLRKVAAGRLDLAVIDAAVLAHLVAQHPDLRDAALPLQLNPRLLERKTLHVAFRRDAEGRFAFERLERGLAATAVAAPAVAPR